MTGVNLATLDLFVEDVAWTSITSRWDLVKLQNDLKGKLQNDLKGQSQSQGHSYSMGLFHPPQYIPVMFEFKFKNIYLYLKYTYRKTGQGYIYMTWG